ncbi:ABC transporter permease [Neomicrococcus lactis]|uniref:ABC transporter permease n=1 Tax=Neomicrococcus lactis TaxID=732241 RepID=UPI0023002FE7|nr:ABC transporter permease [Neomicrococcus lactis]
MQLIRRTILSLIRRPARSLLTFLSLLVATASILVMLATSHSSAAAIAKSLSDYDVTSFRMVLPEETWDTDDHVLTSEVRKLGSVVDAGTMQLPDGSTRPVPLTNVVTGAKESGFVVVASDLGLRTRGASIISGGYPRASAPDAQESLDRLVLIGREVATSLALNFTSTNLPQLEFQGSRFTVVGVVADAPGESLLGSSIIFTPTSGRAAGVLGHNRPIELTVAPNAAEAVAPYAAQALFPAHPASVAIAIPPSETELRQKLSQDSSATIGTVTLVMGIATALGIMTIMQIAVRERRPEIGIMLAHGFSRRSIASGFLTEATLIGLAGTIAGWFIGVVSSAAVVLTNGWTLYFPPEVLLIPLAGAVLGAISGTIPALTASRIQPSELLRAS